MESEENLVNGLPHKDHVFVQMYIIILLLLMSILIQAGKHFDIHLGCIPVVRRLYLCPEIC